MSVLNVPIQINRGESNPSLTNLSEGELYCNLSTSTLFMKASTSVDVNITGQSNSSKNLISNQNLFDFNIDKSSFSIGGFTVTNSLWDSLYGVTLNKIKITNLGKTILTSEMYGKNFPSNPSHGQLFFKLAE